MRNPQESTLSFLLYFFGTCSCTPSELPDSRRLFGTRKFLPLSLFNELLSAFRSGFRCASRLLKYPRFRKGLQRYAFFLYLQIFSQLFLTFLQTFFALNALWSLNRLYDTTLRNSVRKWNFSTKISAKKQIHFDWEFPFPDTQNTRSNSSVVLLPSMPKFDVVDSSVQFAHIAACL